MERQCPAAHGKRGCNHLQVVPERSNLLVNGAEDFLMQLLQLALEGIFGGTALSQPQKGACLHAYENNSGGQSNRVHLCLFCYGDSVLLYVLRQSQAHAQEQTI